MKLLELEQTYEPFSPDSDLLKTRTFSAGGARGHAEAARASRWPSLLEQGNFTRVDPANVHFILTKDSAYGLDLQVDLDAFEEILIYYRGATTITERRRDVRRAYMRWREVKIPVFQRLCLLFKLKPFDVRVREVMQERKIDRKEAEKIVRQLRGLLPATVTSDYVYIKLFKNMPRSDVEMIFPNTKVRFRLFDKIKFGVVGRQRRRHGRVRHGRQDRHCQQSLHAGRRRRRPRRRGSAPGHRLHQSAQRATWWCWRRTSISTPWPTTGA